MEVERICGDLIIRCHDLSWRGFPDRGNADGETTEQAAFGRKLFGEKKKKKKDTQQLRHDNRRGREKKLPILGNNPPKST